MDFFAAQSLARRNSRILVGWFLLAVMCVIAVVYVVLAALFSQTNEGPAPIQWWQPELFIWVFLGVGGVIGAGSLFRVLSLSSGGGQAVAEALGGRLVTRSSSDTLERRLINVVDEMAIASGITAPPVFILDAESGINAFAAGSEVSNGVVAVTRGALEQLTRDELQGVIAHEFSHILNGDMRLNLRLIGVVFGILMLTQAGRILMRASRGSDRSAVPLVGLGLILVLVGYIGVLFGNLIKAAVSRQREFLADAAAVQYTRNPEGIAGALKRIGGFGSNIENPRSEEASHMFFGAVGFSRLFATHPPIEERIRRVDRSFRDLPAAQAKPSIGGIQADLNMGTAGFGGSSSSHSTLTANPGPTQGMQGSIPPLGLAASSAQTPPASQIVASVGKLDAEHIAYAHTVLAALPHTVLNAAHHPTGARPLLLSLFIHRSAAVADLQYGVITTALGPACTEETRTHADWLASTGPEMRLTLLDIALPSLGELGADSRQQIGEVMEALIRADGKVSLLEFALGTIVRHQLLKPARKRSARSDPGTLLRDICSILSILARAGASSEAAAQQAFTAAQAKSPLDGQYDLLSTKDLSARQLEEALDRLAQTSHPFRKRVVEACVAAAMNDEILTASEWELLRAVCVAMDCPMPPLAPQLPTSLATS